MNNRKYYVWSFAQEQSLGPFSERELNGLLVSGELTETSQIWFPGCVNSLGEKEWRPLQSVPELATLCNELPPQRGPELNQNSPKTAAPAASRGTQENFGDSEDIESQGNKSPGKVNIPLVSRSRRSPATSTTQSTKSNIFNKRPKRILRDETSLLGRVFLYDGQEYLSGGAFFLRLLFFYCISLAFNSWASSILYPSELEVTIVILGSLALLYWSFLTFHKRVRSLGFESVVYSLLSFLAHAVWGNVIALSQLPRGSSGYAFLQSLGGFGLVLFAFGFAGFINAWILLFANAKPQRPRDPLNAIRHLELKNEEELTRLNDDLKRLLSSFIPSERHIFFLRKRQLPYPVKKQLQEVPSIAESNFVACVMQDGKLDLAEKHLSLPPDGSDCTLAWKELMRKKGCSIASISAMLE